MGVGAGVVGDVLDRAIFADKKTDTAIHLRVLGHPCTVGVGDFAILVHQQREVQIEFRNKFLLFIMFVYISLDLKMTR